MSSDHQRQLAIDRMLASVRDAAEGTLRSYAAAVAESATDELRRTSSAEIAALRDTVQRLEIARIDVESQLAEARRLLDDTRQAADQLVEDANATRESAIAAERLRADAAIAAAAHDAQTERAVVQRELESRVAALSAQRAAAEAQAAWFRSVLHEAASLAGAGSLGGVLDRLMQVGTRIAPRAAVFTVRGETVSCWRSSGFDAERDTHRLTSVGKEGSVLSAAVRERRSVMQPSLPPVETPAGVTADGPWLAAVPVLISGRVVAALCVETTQAEDPLVREPEARTALETVAGYAGRVLETLTVQQALRAGGPPVRPSHARPDHSLSGSPV